MHVQDMIGLPPEAKAHFDKKANSLIAELKPLPARKQYKQPRGSLAHLPYTHLTDADIIGRLECSYIDFLGRLHGFEIHGDNIHEFLPKEAADELEKIADKVASRHELKEYCDSNYIRKHLVDWIRRHRLQEPAGISWIADLLASLTRDIFDQTILIPLEGIQVEIPFKLGQVSFNYFTESSIDNMLKKLPKGDPDLEKFCEKFRKRYQGCVYTKFQCKAEKNYAKALAIYHTDKALEILKIFNPATFEIRAQCFLGRMGQVIPAQWHAFHVLPNGNVSLSEGIETVRGGAYELRVDEEFVHLFQHSKFGIASQILRKKQITNLEKRCIEAISYFAHGVSSPSPQDRLLHALVAVESLLLRDHNEPVQSHLSYRVALLATSNLENRKKAKQDFLKGYTLRSQFVHHGAKPDDFETANRVLLLCWSAINEVLGLTKRFDTKQALLDSLEDELLTPQ